MRAGVFRFVGVPRRDRRDPERELTFAIGNALHLMWYEIFLHMEKVLGRDEFEVVGIEEYAEFPELMFAGRFDVIVRIRGRLYIVDFKTIKDSGFTFVMRRPDPGHVDQLARYLRLRKVRRGLLFYFNKNDSRWKVFPIAWKDHKAVWSKTVRWVSTAIGYMRRGEVPPKHRDCERGSSMARDCPFEYICYGQESRNMKEIAYGGRRFDSVWEEFRGKAQAGSS